MSIDVGRVVHLEAAASSRKCAILIYRQYIILDILILVTMNFIV